MAVGVSGREDRGGAVAGAGVVEEHEDVCVVLFHGLPERVDILESGRAPVWRLVISWALVRVMFQIPWSG